MGEQIDHRKIILLPLPASVIRMITPLGCNPFSFKACRFLRWPKGNKWGGGCPPNNQPQVMGRNQ